MEDFYGRVVKVGDKILKRCLKSNKLEEAFVAEIITLVDIESLITVSNLELLDKYLKGESVSCEANNSSFLIIASKEGKLGWIQ